MMIFYERKKYFVISRLNDQTEKVILINGCLEMKEMKPFFSIPNVTTYRHEGYTFEDNENEYSVVVEHDSIWIIEESNGFEAIT